MKKEKERKEDRILLFAISFFLQFSIYNEWINPLLKNNRSIKLIESIFTHEKGGEGKKRGSNPVICHMFAIEYY